MVQSYLNGATMKEAAEPFGFHLTTCRNILKRRGIQRRTKSEWMRKYTVDEDFFREIDSPVKAYVLGFISADGYVTEGEGITVNLAREDRGHLVKIRDCLGSSKPIKDYVTRCPTGVYEGSRLSVYSMKMASCLVANGVPQAKSQILLPWPGPEYLLPSYFLGLMDGDGFWFSSDVGSRGVKVWHMGLAGTKAITTAFSEFVFMRTGYSIPVRPHSTIYTARTSRLMILRAVADLLYNEATIYLDRKKAKVDEMRLRQVRHRDWSHLTKDGLLAMRSTEKSWSAVARRLTMDPETLYRILKRLGCS